MNILSKIKFLFPVLFFLALGCVPQGSVVPESDAEIVVLDPEQSPQQIISECDVKSNKQVDKNKNNDSEIFMGFQKQENFGDCMNTKGFIWGVN